MLDYWGVSGWVTTPFEKYAAMAIGFIFLEYIFDGPNNSSDFGMIAQPHC